MLRHLLRSPLALATIVTLANAAKPLAVDDTAYITYARHIASNPTDPYGFTIFWWAKPEPAMTVLAPPVLPYWLAVGVRLFGESPALLKLWLFPFVYLLTWAIRALLARFARGTENFALPLMVFSPAVLPAVNLMLDVPAAALVLASVELFARAVGRAGRLPSSLTSLKGGGQKPTTRPARVSSNWPLVFLVGVVAALAMQTKYIGFVAPAALAWYGLVHRRVGAAAVAVVVCVSCFVGWEWWLTAKYGESHFRYHASGVGRPDTADELYLFVRGKAILFGALAGHLGGLAVGGGFLAAFALGVPRRWLIGAAVVWCGGFALVAVLPRRGTVLSANVAASAAFWAVSGAAWLAAGVTCAVPLLVRMKKGLHFRLRADVLFLVGWLAIEIGAALMLSPFPAARRVIGISLVMGLLAARAASRVSRVHATRTPQWVLAVGVGAGVAVAAIDTLDAFPEKVCAERSADVTRDRPETSTVWFVGHWGFQYYCERAGMRPLVPGETIAQAGDFVVLPVYPTSDGFHRPHAGFAFVEPVWVGDEVAVIEWTDPLSAQTVPNFYGGIEPVAGRDSPRLKVRVYRLRTGWAP
jgi:hypothetical protein